MVYEREQQLQNRLHISKMTNNINCPMRSISAGTQVNTITVYLMMVLCHYHVWFRRISGDKIFKMDVMTAISEN